LADAPTREASPHSEISLTFAPPWVPADFSAFEEKMQADGMSDAAIASFRYNYEQLVQGVTGLLPESEIQPVTTLPSLESLKRARAGHRFAARLSDARARAAAAASGDKAQALLAKTCILKLNGGLGTSMGLEKAKSLLPVKDGKTFLDLIAMQILHARTAFGSEVAFVLMNSFSTSEDTEEFLMTSYPELLTEENIELLQNKSPKIDKATLAPASWPENPALEWCPPGHGEPGDAMAAGLKDVCFDVVRMGGSGKSSCHPLPESEPEWRCQRGSATKGWVEKRLLLGIGKGTTRRQRVYQRLERRRFDGGPVGPELAAAQIGAKGFLQARARRVIEQVGVGREVVRERGPVGANQAIRRASPKLFAAAESADAGEDNQISAVICLLKRSDTARAAHL
jgi:hypothetical protein